MQGWLSILIMIALGAGFAPGRSSNLFTRGNRRRKSAPYECGIAGRRCRNAVGQALVAMIFLLFDIEVAFLYPYDALRDLGWAGSCRCCFLSCCWRATGVWRKGALIGA
jgi:NADH:ubiquinone oxidoreductase subunit 3 (subunit A)